MTVGKLPFIATEEEAYLNDASYVIYEAAK